MTMSEALLQCVNLKKYFDTPRGELHAVDDVSFEIPAKRTLGVVGESGCGKSTLGRTILRLTPHTSGQVFFAGEDILKFPKERMKEMRREMQMVFQDPFSSLNPKYSVYQLIEEPILIHQLLPDKKKREERIYELMNLVGLAERYVNAYPHELDGGRRQRIGIARALAVNPKFIVCDEPVSALDVSIQAQILNLLMDLKDELGLTYIFITHDLSVVKHISDEIMVMYLGQMIEKARPDELFQNPLHPYTKALLSAIPIPDLAYRYKEAEPIKGEVTSPINPPPGCRFASRCPQCTQQCREKNPVLQEVEPGHVIACHLYQNDWRE